MNVSELQQRLASRFAGDHIRSARMAYFMGLLKTSVDGMAGLGVVLRVECDGLAQQKPLPPTIDPLASLDTAIALMQKASRHATHEEREEDQVRDGADLRE